MASPLILLPPSEGKAPGGDGPAWEKAEQSFDELLKPRRQVLAALRKAMKENEAARTKLLGVKGQRVAEATAANLVAHKAATLPAIERYTGVLYDALDYSSLPAGLRKRVDKQVVIFSGLWGAVRPGDLIPDYKLKMGAKLSGFGPPARFWKPLLTAALAGPAAGCVWDLLPNEHSAAWDASVARSRIRVRFVDDVEKDGERKLVTVAHWNKLLKGALVRYVVEHQLVDPAGLADFTHPEGYVYAPELTQVSGPLTEVSLVAVR